MVPKLRFKEFTANWKDQVLKDVCSVIMDGTHFSPKSKDGPKKYITSKNIRNEGMLLDDVAYISEEEHRAIYKKCPVQHGDVLLTKDGANTGNCCLNSLKEEFSLLSSVAVIRGKENSLKSSYLLQVLQSKRGQSKINDHIAGQAITRITLKKINEFAFSIPAFDEQTKISDFLSSVDEKITLLNKQYNLLCQYKKGMMQKIFSQEIRFKDENGEMFPAWQENSLSSLGNAYNGLTGKTAEDFGKGVFYITYKQIFDNRIINPKGFGLVNISENEKQNKVEYGDLFFTTSSETPDEVAFCSVFLETELIDCYLNSFCFGYRVKNIDRSDPVFLSFLFRSGYFRAKVKTLAQGSTRYNISKTQFMMLSVNIPVTKEQTKIANFLSFLDDKIAAKKAELDKLKIWKQGLLQQMFV